MRYKNITAEELKRILKENPNAVVLDVRTPAEVRQGKIPGASTIDIMDGQFAEKVEKLDKDKAYLVYCRSGNRSSQAYQYMESKGFNNLHNLVGGISSWREELE